MVIWIQHECLYAECLLSAEESVSSFTWGTNCCSEVSATDSLKLKRNCNEVIIQMHF